MSKELTKMLSKKEMEDMEMAKKGAEVLKEKLDKISELEKRIAELEVIVEIHKIALNR